MAAIANTKTPSQISPKNYKVVHYVGGGSAMFGISDNKAIQDVVMSTYANNNGILSAVCHGTAGIVDLKVIKILDNVAY